MVKAQAARGGRKTSRSRYGDLAKAKEAFLISLGDGFTVEGALREVERSSRSTYESWRRVDEDFARRADAILARRGVGARRGTEAAHKQPVPDFETFCREYLSQPLFLHQLQWVDVLEGRVPRDLHPAMTFEKGSQQFVLINTPPEHAKSSTLTMNYITWRILENPNVKVLIVSGSEKMAKKFLYGIKQRLTGQRYRRLQEDFGPDGGFAADAATWSATMIYVGGKDDGEKDPTVEALGMGGQIYGARADIIVVDDAVLKKNAHDYEEQAEWLAQEVITRLGRTGTMLVVGTRVASMDLYKYLRREYEGAWTYLAQPAVLEQHGEPDEWVTLWPKTLLPDDDGRLVEDEKWSGRALNDQRKRFMSPAQWARVFMQADVDSAAIFPEAAVIAALNKQRTPGLLIDGAPGHRPGGMMGLYVICSMDPALAGGTAAFVIALDPNTGKRWVLDGYSATGLTPAKIRELIFSWTEKYQPREWRIEKNAMQGMITQDEDVRQFLAARGCRLTEHYTDTHKWDGDYGVAGLAPLFLAGLAPDGTNTGKRPLIDLPANKVTGGAGVQAIDVLVQQLITWEPMEPGRRARANTTDAVMALWFADVRCREMVKRRDTEVSYASNPYLSRAGRKRQHVIDLNELRLQQEQEAVVVGF